jgi:hypothetical protein
VGAPLTLPPHPQPPPGSRTQRTRRLGPDADQDLVPGVDVDQPTTSHATPTAELERDDDLALEAAAARLHRELAQTDPGIGAAAAPQPLGRRLPQPLDASRQGVER